MSDQPAALQELLDHGAIRDVLLRYARGVDRRDLEIVASCFIPGAEYEGALGRGTIETALATLERSMGRYARTLHFIGNQLIELNGDTASSETYALAYHVLRADESQQLTVAVRYLDDFIRHDGAWRIRRRVVQTEWQQTGRVTPPASSRPLKNAIVKGS